METHTYELRLAGDCSIPVVYTVVDGALTSYAIEDQERARVRGCGYQEWRIKESADAYRAGFNTALGKWPR